MPACRPSRGGSTWDDGHGRSCRGESLPWPVDRPAKLASPDHSACHPGARCCLRSVQASGEGRLVNVFALARQVSPAMLLPCWSQPRWKICTNLHVALGQAAAKQSSNGRRCRRLVHGRARTCRECAWARSRCRPARGPAPSACGQRHLVLSDPGLGLGVGELVELMVVQAVDRIRARGGGWMRRHPCGLERKRTRVAGGAEGDPWSLGGQIAGPPETVVDGLRGRLARPRGGHHDKRRQVLVPSSTQAVS